MTRRPVLLGILEGVLVSFACVLLVALSHDIGYVLHAPYWLDEAWVAVSTRLPVGDLLQVTSSTPPGWNLLQRLFEPLGLQAARLLPLVFLAASGSVAYYAARAIVRERVPLGRLVGVCAAVAVILVPASLARNDLKQYTCDGFVALLVVLLTAVAERSGWSRRSLWTLAGVGVAGFAVSITAIFPLAAAGIVWLVSGVGRRGWRSLLTGALPVGSLIVGLSALYFVVYEPATNSRLNAFWADYYPSFQELPAYVSAHVQSLDTLLIFGSWWVTAAGVTVAIGLLAARWRSALAVFPVALGLLAIVAGVARRYPLLDQRTSNFLIITMTFFAAVGLASGILLLCTISIRRTAVLWTVATPVAAAMAAALLVVSVHGMRQHNIPEEDARSQIEYVQGHASPKDVILLNEFANYAFGYYWSEEAPAWVKDTQFATAFRIAYPHDPRILIAADDSTTWIAKAEALAAERGSRVWVIRTHVKPSVRSAWDTAMPGATVLPVGPEPLAELPG